ncbi:MAG: (2E,6E)-farnesyl diphosphate synthase [Acidiferrobacterales bacterium]
MSFLHDFLPSSQVRVEQALDRHLPSVQTEPQRLHEAMRYAVVSGGKRLRAALVYATGETLGAKPEQLDAPASALELIHAYSLIHDDLPAMDNDDLRRGKPSCHRAFDEATALLAGDALQTRAFEILANAADPSISAQRRLDMVARLAEAAGSLGMAGGQAIDLQAVGRTLDVAELENMHARKTGALFRAAVALGALSAPRVSAATLAALDRYAACIGLAFQITDDILDVEASTATLGKPQGSDQRRKKPTYSAILGIERARALARAQHEAALASLAGLGDNMQLLVEIAGYIQDRTR